MVEGREDQIRERAYRLWEEAGRPEGQHETHWNQASGEVGTTVSGRGQADDQATVDQLTPSEATVAVTTSAPPRRGSEPEAKGRKPL
jgi:hypothetical protein